MYNPGWGHIGDLEFPYSFVIATPHEYTHYNECGEGDKYEEYLLWRMIKDNGKYEAGSICDFNHNKLPRLFCIFREQQTANEIAQIEQSPSVCPDEEKIQHKKQTSAALHQKKVFVAFTLEGSDDDDKSDYSASLCDYIYHIRQQRPFGA